MAQNEAIDASRKVMFSKLKFMVKKSEVSPGT